MTVTVSTVIVELGESQPYLTSFYKGSFVIVIRDFVFKDLCAPMSSSLLS